MRTRLLMLGGVLALAIGASGCSSMGKALGMGKNAPDEFAIATKAPLVIPPDYALRPPKPGESRPAALSPSERARQVLLGDASSAPPSLGEQHLLRKANAFNADPNIRAVLASENGGRAEKDASLANALIFWKVDHDKIDFGEAPLRVDDQQEWLDERLASINKATGGEEVKIKSDRALALPGVY